MGKDAVGPLGAKTVSVLVQNCAEYLVSGAWAG